MLLLQMCCANFGCTCQIVPGYRLSLNCLSKVIKSLLIQSWKKNYVPIKKRAIPIKKRATLPSSVKRTRNFPTRNDKNCVYIVVICLSVQKIISIYVGKHVVIHAVLNLPWQYSQNIVLR